MTLRNLPEIKAFQRPKNFQWDAGSEVLTKWSERPLAAEADEPNTISIYDVIGEDPWSGGGFTAARMAAALRSIGKNSVVVNINSPGGDLFEGVAIYNLLREHPAKVTINIVGIAASAASIIAMAGDEILMGLGTFMMIHNAWGMVIGNRHEMRAAADLFDAFDSAIADIYEARTGMKRSQIEKLMDAETFMAPTEAVEKGFADALDKDIKVKEKAKNEKDSVLMARRQVEAGLAKAGLSRKERSELLSEMVSATQAPRDASRPPAARDAGITAAILQLTQTMRP